MRVSLRLSCLFVGVVLPSAGAQEKPTKPLAAVVESSLPSAAGQIRQFAFDGDPGSYFASAKNAAVDDHFTLIFDSPVRLKRVDMTTGRPDGSDKLKSALLEVAEDGKKFEMVARFFVGGDVQLSPPPEVLAVRVKVTGDHAHPLVIRDLKVVSDPPVAVFKYPIEFAIDVSDAPEMKEWAEKTARVCEREYTMICDELMSPGFKPRTAISMTLKNDYKGVAAAGGGKITGSVKYFKSKPGDVGAMVHETVHCVQNYRTRGNPSWLVEGVADYIRFFKYEPGKLGRINPEKAKYNASYRTSAAFLAYVTENTTRSWCAS